MSNNNQLDKNNLPSNNNIEDLINNLKTNIPKKKLGDPDLPTLGSSPSNFGSKQLEDLYDEGFRVSPDDTPELFNEIKALNQGNLSKVSNGLVRMLGTGLQATIEPFVDGTYGASKASVKGKFSYIYDNEISNWMDGLNENLKENFPIYYTRQQQEMGVESAIPFSGNAVNFWSDKVLDGLGYLLGSIGSALITRGISARTQIFKMPKYFQKLAKSYSDIKRTSQVANQLQKEARNIYRLKNLETLNISTVAAVGEAAVEARQTKQEIKDTLTSYRDQGLAGYADLTDEEIESQAALAGNVNFGINMAVVSGSNYVQFARFFNKGFANMSKNYLKTFVGKDGKLLLHKNKLQKLTSRTLPYVKGMAVEGLQEGTQFASNIALQEYFIPNINKESNENTINLIDSTVKSLEETLGSNEGQESILLGAILGAFGAGTFSRGERVSQRKLTKEMIDVANNLGTKEKVSEFISLLNRSYSFQQQLEEAIIDGDRHKFENGKFGELFSLVDSYVKLEREDLLYDMIDNHMKENEEDLGKLSNLKQELKSFVENYKKNEKNIDIRFPNLSNEQRSLLLFSLSAGQNAEKRYNELLGELSSEYGLHLAFDLKNENTLKEYAKQFGAFLEILDKNESDENIIKQIRKKISSKLDEDIIDKNEIGLFFESVEQVIANDPTKLQGLTEILNDIVKLEDRRKTVLDEFAKYTDLQAFNNMKKSAIEQLKKYEKYKKFSTLVGINVEDFEKEEKKYLKNVLRSKINKFNEKLQNRIKYKSILKNKDLNKIDSLTDSIDFAISQNVPLTESEIENTEENLENFEKELQASLESLNEEKLKVNNYDPETGEFTVDEEKLKEIEEQENEIKEQLDKISKTRNQFNLFNFDILNYDEVSEDQIKKDFAETYMVLGKGIVEKAKLEGANRIYNSKNIKQQIVELKSLLDLYKNKNFDFKGIQEVIGDISNLINELENILKIAEENENNRNLKQKIAKINNIIKLSHSLGFSVNGINSKFEKEISPIIRMMIGNDFYNLIQNKLNEDFENAEVYLNIVLERISEIDKNSELFKKLNDTIEELKKPITNSLSSFIDEKSNSFKLNNFSKKIYFDNPKLGYFRVVSSLMTEHDKTNPTALFEFLKSNDEETFNQSISLENRPDGDNLTKEDLLKFSNLHSDLVLLTNLSTIVKNNLSYREFLINKLKDLEKLKKQNKFALTESQEISLMELLRFQTKKINSNSYFDNCAFLKGYAGTGKTTLLRYFIKLSGLKNNEIIATAHNKSSSKVINNTINKTTNNSIEEIIDLFENNKITKDTKLLIIDEAPAISEELLEKLILLVNEKNKLDFNIKIVFLGDPNQIVNFSKTITFNNKGYLIQSNFFENVTKKTNKLYLDKKDLTVINPLSIRYRTNINAIVDFQDLFINQLQDVRKSNLVVSSNYDNQNVENAKGVYSSKNFKQDLINFLNKSKDNKKRKVVITDETKVDEYKKLLSENNITDVEVLTPLEAQGINVENVFMDLQYNENLYQNMNDYNTQLYVGSSRSVEFLMVTGFDNFVNYLDPNLEENEAKNKEEIVNRLDDKIESSKKEIEIYNSLNEENSINKEEQKNEKEEPEPILPEEEDTEEKDEEESELESESEPTEEDEEVFVEYTDTNIEETDDIEEKPEPTKKATGTLKLTNPRNKSIGSETIPGAEVGDKVIFVKASKNNNKQMIFVLTEKENDPGIYQEIGVLSKEEVENLGIDFENTLISELVPFEKQEEGEFYTIPETSFFPISGYENAKIHHVQKLKIVYNFSKKIKVNAQNIVQKINKVFDKNPTSISKIRYRIFTRRSLKSFVKENYINMPDYEIKPGIPYAIVELQNGKLLIIRTDSKKLNNQKHSYLLKPIEQFIDLKKQIISLLDNSIKDGYELNQLIVSLAKDEITELTDKIEKQLTNDQFDNLVTLSKTLFDLCEEKLENDGIVSGALVKLKNPENTTYEFFKSDRNPSKGKSRRVKNIIKEEDIDYAIFQDGTKIPFEELTVVDEYFSGPAQKSLNQLAISNSLIDDIYLRGARVKKSSKDSLHLAKKLLVVTERSKTLKSLFNKKDELIHWLYVNNKANNESIEYIENLSFSKNTFSKFIKDSYENEGEITNELLNKNTIREFRETINRPLLLEDLEKLFTFDEKGDSNIKGGFGFRIPLSINREGKITYINSKGNKVPVPKNKIGDFIETSFEKVIPTSVEIDLGNAKPKTKKTNAKSTTPTQSGIEAEKQKITPAEFKELTRLAKFFLENPKEPTVSGSVVGKYPELFKVITEIEKLEREREKELFTKKGNDNNFGMVEGLIKNMPKVVLDVIDFAKTGLTAQSITDEVNKLHDFKSPFTKYDVRDIREYLGIPRNGAISSGFMGSNQPTTQEIKEAKEIFNKWVDSINKINAKYDAKLKALKEQLTTPTQSTKSKEADNLKDVKENIEPEENKQKSKDTNKKEDIDWEDLGFELSNNKYDENSLGKKRNKKEIINIIKKRIPNITNQEIRFVDILTMQQITGGKSSWGYWKKGVIYLRENPDQTVFENIALHEVIHEILNSYFTKDEYNKIIELGKIKYKLKSDASSIEVEEKIAEDYQNKNYPSNLLGKAIKLIQDFIKFITNNYDEIDRFFDNVNKGYYTQKVSPDLVNETFTQGKELHDIARNFGTTDEYIECKNTFIQLMYSYSSLIPKLRNKNVGITKIINNKQIVIADNKKIFNSLFESLVLLRLDLAKRIDEIKQNKNLNENELKDLNILEKLYAIDNFKNFIREIYPSFEKSPLKFLSDLDNKIKNKEDVQEYYTKLRDFEDSEADLDYYSEDNDGEEITETDEQINEVEDEIIAESLGEQIREGDEVNNETKLKHNVQNFLSTIPIIVNNSIESFIPAKDAYKFLAKNLYNIKPGKNSEVRIFQILTSPFNSKEAKAIKNHMLNLMQFANSETYNGKKIPDNFKFTYKEGSKSINPDIFEYTVTKNGKIEKRYIDIVSPKGNKILTYAFISKIYNQLKNDSDVVLNETFDNIDFINHLYNLEVANNTLNEIFTSLNSLRYRNVYWGKQYQKSDFSGTTYGINNYTKSSLTKTKMYNQIISRVLKIVDSNQQHKSTFLIEIENLSKLNGKDFVLKYTSFLIKNKFVSNGFIFKNKDIISGDIRNSFEFFRYVNHLLANNNEQLKAIKKELLNSDEVDLEEKDLINKDDNFEHLIRRQIENEQNNNLYTLINILDNDQVLFKEDNTYTSGDGKQKWMLTNSSFATDTLHSLIVGLKEVYNEKIHFNLSFYKKYNSFLNDNNEIYEVTDWDNLEYDGLSKNIPYKKEKFNQFFIRTLSIDFGVFIRNSHNVVYNQPIYITSNKPKTTGAIIKVRSKSELKRDLINLILQEQDFYKNYASDKSLKNKKWEKLRSSIIGLDKVYDSSKDNIEKLVQEVNKELDKHAKKLLDSLIDNKFNFDSDVIDTISKLSNYRLLHNVGSKNFRNDFSKRISKKHYDISKDFNDSEYKALYEYVNLYVYNSYINGFNLNQLVAGHPLFYKDEYDIVKRMSGSDGIGQTGRVNEKRGLRKKYKVVILKDIENIIKEEDYRNSKSEGIRKLANYLSKIKGLSYESTDAQSYIIPYRKENIVKGFGRSYMFKSVLKPMYFGLDSKGIPRFIKTSSIELTDKLCKEFEGLADLRFRLESKGMEEGVKERFRQLFFTMLEDNTNDLLKTQYKELLEDNKNNLIEEAVFQSGLKVGQLSKTFDIRTDDIIDDLSVIELDNENYRLQLNPKAKIDSFDKAPSQINYQLNASGLNENKAKDLWNTLASIMDTQYLSELDSLYRQIKNADYFRAKQYIKNLVLKRIGLSRSNETFHDYLSNRHTSINMPAITNKFISQLNSIFAKNSIEVKFPGSKFVLQSTFGIESFNKSDSKSKEPQIKIDDKGNYYAECYIPIDLKNKFNVNDLIFDKDPMLFGFRLPSTGLHSSIPLKVIGYYPTLENNESNIVIVPKEIVLLHGSDFDVDSLFVIRYDKVPFDYTLKYNKKTYTFRKNEILQDNKEDLEKIEILKKAIHNYRNNNIKLEKLIKYSNPKDKSYSENLEILKNNKREIKKLSKIYLSALKSKAVNIYLETSLKNVKEMMTPIDMITKIKTVNDVNSKNASAFDVVHFMLFSEKNIEENHNELYSKRHLGLPLDDQLMHYDNFSGNGLVGQFANFTKALYLFDAINDENDKVLFKDGYVTEIDEFSYNGYQRTEKGNDEVLIMETSDTFINLAIDNVKEQVLALINLTNELGNTSMSMVFSGMPISLITKLLLQPASLLIKSNEIKGFKTEDKLNYVKRFYSESFINKLTSLESFKKESQVLNKDNKNKILKSISDILINNDNLIKIRSYTSDKLDSTSLFNALYKKQYFKDFNEDQIKEAKELIDDIVITYNTTSSNKGIHKQYGGLSTENSYNIIDNLSYKVIDPLGHVEKLSLNDIVLQAKVARLLAKHSVLGGEIYNFSKAIKILQEFPSTYADLEEIVKAWKNIYITENLSDFKSYEINPNFPFKNVDILKLSNLKSALEKLVRLKSLINETILKHNPKLIAYSEDIISEYNLNTLDYGKNTKSRISEILRSDFITYILASIKTEVYVNNNKEKIELYVPENFTVKNQRNRKTYTGTDAWIQNFIWEIENLKSNPKYKDNKFLQEIKITNSWKKGFQNHLRKLEIDKFNKLSFEEIIDLRNHFLMLNDSFANNSKNNNFYNFNRLQYDFAKYTILAQGANFGLFNFSMIMPPELYGRIISVLDKSLYDLLIKNDTENILDSLTNSFMIQFAMNNPSLMYDGKTLEPYIEGNEEYKGHKKHSGKDEINGKISYYDFRSISNNEKFPKIINRNNRLMVLSEIKEVEEGNYLAYYVKIGGAKSSKTYQGEQKLGEYTLNIDEAFDSSKHIIPHSEIDFESGSAISIFKGFAKTKLKVGDTIYLKYTNDYKNSLLARYVIEKVIEEDNSYSVVLNKPVNNIRVNNVRSGEEAIIKEEIEIEENPEMGEDGVQQSKNLQTIKPGVPELFESNPELANSVYETLGFNQNNNPYSIKDFSFFASFGNPKGFLEAKKIGESNDRLPKTTQYKDTDFYTALEILSDERKKLSIHFKHLEKGSNRGGGHAGLVFVFDKEKKIDNNLVNNLISKVDKFRQDNFNKEGDNYRIKSNNPSDINPVDVRDFQITPQQKQQAQQLYSQYLDTIFPDSKVTLSKKFADTYNIVFNGETIGTIHIPSDLEGDTISIGDVSIKPEFRGKGLGVETYKAAIKIAGKPLESFMATDEANRVWNSLIKQGLAKKTDTGFITTFPLLGSKQDIEGFKDFLDKKDSYFSKKIETNETNRSNEVLNKSRQSAERLSKRFNVPSEFITLNEAKKIHKHVTKDTKGFFKNNKIYLIEDNITEDTVFHEFSHPLIEHIFKTNKDFYNNLKQEADKLIELKEAVKNAYPEYVENNELNEDGYKELIVTAIGLETVDSKFFKDNYENKTLKEIGVREKASIRIIFNKIMNFFKKLFNIKQANKTIANRNIHELALYLTLNDEKINLNDSDKSLIFNSKILKPDLKYFMDKFKDLNLVENNLDSYYEDSSSKKYERLTDFVQKVFSVRYQNVDKNLSIGESFANNYYKSKGIPLENKDKIKVTYQGKEVSYDELKDIKEKEYSTYRLLGSLIHANIELVLKKSSGRNTKDVEKRKEELINKLQGNNKFLPANFQAIQDADVFSDPEVLAMVFDKLGFNLLPNYQDNYNAKYPDSFESEMKVKSDLFNFGSTIDLAIQHKDGNLSILDFKTGRKLLKEIDYPTMLKYFEDLHDGLPDNKLSRAKLEIVLRAFALKEQNVNVRFKNLKVVHLDSTNPKSFEIDLGEVLTGLKKYVKNEILKNDPVKFKELEDKGMFDYKQYYGSSSVQEEFPDLNYLSSENLTFEQKKELILNELQSLQSLSKKEFRSESNQIKMERLTQALYRLKFVNEPDVFGIETSKMGDFKTHLGSKNDTNSKLLQKLFRLISESKTKALEFFNNDQNKLDKLFEKVLNEFYSKNPSLKLTNKTLPTLTYLSDDLNGSGLFDFMVVRRESSDKISGLYRLTNPDISNIQEDRDKWNSLTSVQKEYLETYSNILNKNYKNTLNEQIRSPYSGKKITKAKLSNLSEELPHDFLPRIPKSSSELLEGGDVIEKGKKLKEQFARNNFNFIKNNYYQEKNTQFNMPVKYIGSDYVIKNELHSNNFHDAFSMFNKNLHFKKQLDGYLAVGEAIEGFYKTLGETHYGNVDEFSNNIKFLKNQLDIQVSSDKQDFQLSRKPIKIGNKSIDQFAIINSLKNWNSSLALMLKPFNGISNGIFNILIILKNSIVFELMKSNSNYSKLGNYGMKEMVQGMKIFLSMNSPVPDKKAQKLKLLAKHINYLPDDHDFKIRKSDSMASKAKWIDSTHLYFFHKIGEDLATYNNLYGQLKSLKTVDNNGNEISMWDAYDIINDELVYVGGIRGKEVSGKELTGLTSEEITAMKRINQRMFGAYRAEERNALSTTAIGSLIMQFKKYVPTVLINAFETSRNDQTLGSFVKVAKDIENKDIYQWQEMAIEGRMLVFAKVLMNMIRIKNDPNYTLEALNDNPIKKADFYHSVVTASMFLVMILGAFSVAPDDDDDLVEVLTETLIGRGDSKDGMIYNRYLRMVKDVTEGLHPLDILDSFERWSSIPSKIKNTSFSFVKLMTEGVGKGRVNDDGYPVGFPGFAKGIPVLSSWYELSKLLGEINDEDAIQYFSLSRL